MTADAIKAASTETYSVAKYKRGGKFVCWYTRIGYIDNKMDERVRAWQYHTKDYAKAQHAALELGGQWDVIVAKYKKDKAFHDHWIRHAIFVAATDGYYLDDNDEKVAFSGTKSEVAEYRARLEADPDVPPPSLPTWPKSGQQSAPKSRENGSHKVEVGITIGDAKKKYLADYRKRVGLQSEAGLKQRTANQHEKTLDLAFKPVDPETPLLEFDAEKIEAVAHYWASPARKLAPRTAGNYAVAFWQFLLRLPDLKLGYVLPKVDKRLFRFAKTKGKVAKYNPKQLKALLNALDDEAKLFQLLALNCGFYQGDLCSLRADEIVEIEGKTYIVRKRDKTSHQNDFASQWYLWPETATLLKKQFAKSNPGGLALLRPDGTPMSPVGKSSDDWPTLRFAKVKEAAGEIVGDFTFKQFRKIGYTSIKKLTLNTELSRMYSAKVVTDAEYDRDDYFEPLTAALEKWHELLIKDEVLP